MTHKTVELRDLRVLEDTRYVSFKRCEHLRHRVQELWDHAEVCLQGGGSRRRILAVIGESGTGKTTSLRRVFNDFGGFKRYRNEQGKLVIPMISAEVPRPCTNKDLAIHMLNQLMCLQTIGPMNMTYSRLSNLSYVNPERSSFISTKPNTCYKPIRRRLYADFRTGSKA